MGDALRHVAKSIAHRVGSYMGSGDVGLVQHRLHAAGWGDGGMLPRGGDPRCRRPRCVEGMGVVYLIRRAE